MAVNQKLKLTRNQLATFLDSFEKIRQFERLLRFTDTNVVSIDELQADVENLTEDVNFLQTAPLLKPNQKSRVGSFYDTTTQIAAASNTAYEITLNTTDISRGVYIGSPTSRIYVIEPSIYDIQFSARLSNTSASDHLAFIWLRINGSDVAHSASRLRVKGTTGELVAAWNWFCNLKSNDYVEIMYSVANVSVQLTALAAVAPVPAIPSVIVTVSNHIES
jgi:hypothetical protein